MAFWKQLLVSLGSPEDDPARAAQFHDQVRRVCAGLDATERQLVELRLQGYRTVEAAEQLSLDADVLRVRLSRLRHRLEAEGVFTDWL